MKLACIPCLIALCCKAAIAQDAKTFDLTEEFVSCESRISLPEGYHFAKESEDCQYNENLTVVTKDGKYGYANTHGKIIIEPMFDMAENFDDGMALIKQGKRYGYINPKGRIVIKPQFAGAWGFWEGRAKIESNGKYGFIDKR